MISINSIVITVVAVVISYFIGNISPATVVGKLHGVDIRKEGSGNPGTTNVLRTLGVKAAACTLLIDVLKGIIPVLAGRLIGGEDLACFCGTAAFFGHIWPVCFGFKGGKGILCSGTLLLLLDWRIAAVGWGLFALLWLTTRYVSLGSVSGAVSFPVTTLIFCPGNWTVFVLSLLIAALVIWAHRENISRLLHGTESRFRWRTDAP